MSVIAFIVWLILAMNVKNSRNRTPIHEGRYQNQKIVGNETPQSTSLFVIDSKENGKNKKRLQRQTLTVIRKENCRRYRNRLKNLQSVSRCSIGFEKEKE